MKRIHVAAAVIYDIHQEQILLAKRPNDKHQGGKWEFPGGKIEPHESVMDALIRELDEELGIQVTHAQPLIQIHHNYSDKHVLLDIWDVTAFSGKPRGAEGQKIKWVDKTELNNYDFPEANQAILKALALPNMCLITPDPSKKFAFLEKLEQVLESGITLLQFRAKSLNTDDYLNLARQVIKKAHDHQAKVILNSPPTLLSEADGLHLTSTQLMTYQQRPTLQQGQTLSASCHSITELQQAQKLQTDFVLLSPVQATSSHPNATAMGWDIFHTATQTINCPVYALGGLGRNDIPKARQYGAQGIAAITQLWKTRINFDSPH